MRPNEEEKKQLVAWVEIYVEHVKRQVDWVEQLGLDPGPVLSGPRKSVLADLGKQYKMLAALLKHFRDLLARREFGNLRSTAEQIPTVMQRILAVRAIYGGRNR